jgi:hypothetical protein
MLNAMQRRWEGVLVLHTISEALSRRLYLIGGTVLVRSFV